MDDPTARDSGADQAARRALLLLGEDVDSLVLADPAELRHTAGRSRRRLLGVAGVAAAVLLVALVGVLGLLGRGDDDRLPAGPSPQPTTSASPSFDTSGAPTDGPDAEAPAGTDVIGDDGSLGPFRTGMDRATVQEAIRSAGLEGTVRIASRDLGGGIVDRVLLQPGAATTVGDGDVIGTFDRETDRLSALVAPATAHIHGLGVGSPVGAFEDEFPGRVHLDESSSVYLLDLEGGVRLQLGRPSAYLDRSAVAALVVIPPMAPTFQYFD
ncbi:hypothetical protein KMZ32_18695 [Phycicoccus sp. MAQZ13P-2]|uniref:hypothetical protein n=1 Tax=Phycicoccus mangrovi TaxID=2840470 RepID=UPI001BFFF126|nr:hypothetical protein [Phycicoccus mangrovi]MBT9257667.1 hypothetical protein [Phycicoccus mangrovi]MBT9276107.1 hypothetical protein [Phycicoccus mangrovi]